MITLGYLFAERFRRNNEEREQTIDRVLEIIDKHINRYEKGKKECRDMTGVYVMCKAVAVDIKDDVLALRGNNK